MHSDVRSYGRASASVAPRQRTHYSMRVTKSREENKGSCGTTRAGIAPPAALERAPAQPPTAEARGRAARRPEGRARTVPRYGPPLGRHRAGPDTRRHGAQGVLRGRCGQRSVSNCGRGRPGKRGRSSRTVVLLGGRDARGVGRSEGAGLRRRRGLPDGPGLLRSPLRRWRSLGKSALQKARSFPSPIRRPAEL